MHHYDEYLMESKDKSKNTLADRITISLAPGQREFLEEIAQNNKATLPFVVRYALNEFFDKYKGIQLPLFTNRP